jgi:acetyl-CoA/propionyl-CoA carboxylase biotin carboxyl carrier protein
MRRALGEFEVEGVPTTIPFHQRVIAHPAFISAGATTGFLVEYPEVLPPPADRAAASNGVTPPATRDILVEVDGRRLTVRLPAGFGADGGVESKRPPASNAASSRGKAGGSKPAGNELLSPIQGTVIRVAVEAGQPVAAGDLVCVVEAMKMENEIVSHRDGVIAQLPVASGDAVAIGALLAVIA